MFRKKECFSTGPVLAVSRFLLIDVLSVLAFNTNSHLIPPKPCCLPDAFSGPRMWIIFIT